MWHPEQLSVHQQEMLVEGREAGRVRVVRAVPVGDISIIEGVRVLADMYPNQALRVTLGFISSLLGGNQGPQVKQEDLVRRVIPAH